MGRSEVAVPTPASAYVEIAGHWLENAQMVQWTENTNKRPLFGVLDTYYRTTTTGRQLVQGTIGIYSDHTDQFLKTLYYSSIGKEVPGERSFRAAIAETIKTVDRQSTNAAKLEELVNILVPSKGKERLSTEYKKQIIDSFASFYGDYEQRRSVIDNGKLAAMDGLGIDLTKVNPADIEFLRTIPPFDMKLAYCNIAEQENARQTGSDHSLHRGPLSYDILADVVIIGKTKGFQNAPQQSGMPIMEYYSFVSRYVTRRKIT